MVNYSWLIRSKWQFSRSQSVDQRVANPDGFSNPKPSKTNRKDESGGFHKWGYTHAGGLLLGNILLKLMMKWGTPVSGNLHITIAEAQSISRVVLAGLGLECTFWCNLNLQWKSLGWFQLKSLCHAKFLGTIWHPKSRLSSVKHRHV